MTQDTVLGGVIAFFVRLGIYDVVLPFLLVFTLMYAILEKSKILGTEKIGADDKASRKNLNAMTAFVVAFLVVASSKLVEILLAISAKVIIILALLVFFLMLIGTFYGHDEEVKLDGNWRKFFVTLVFIGIAIIFLDSIKMKSGQTLLEWIWSFGIGAWMSTAAASVIFILLLIGFMYYITNPGTPAKTADKDKKDGDKK